MRYIFTFLVLLGTYAMQAQQITLTPDTSEAGKKLIPKYPTVDVQPVFKGDMQAYMAKNLRVPPGNKQKGRIMIEFVIDSTGAIGPVNVMNKPANKPNTPLEKEFIRVIKGMPRWTPGMREGVKVPVLYQLPLDLN